MASGHSSWNSVSLPKRLRGGDSIEGWQQFYATYREPLRAFARRGGLTDSESEELVQETAIGVARHLASYRHEPTRCSFTTWVLNLARWRVLDLLRCRARSPAWRACGSTDRDTRGSHRRIEEIPDPHAAEFGSEVDEAWEQSLRNEALERVRGAVDPWQFQMFEDYVLKGHAPGEVARRMGVSTARVYLAKQRVCHRLRQELRRLKSQNPC